MITDDDMKDFLDEMNAAGRGETVEPMPRLGFILFVALMLVIGLFSGESDLVDHSIGAVQECRP